MNVTRFVRIAAALGLAAAALGGCVVAPVGPPVSAYPYGGGEVVPMAPPPPQVEVYGPPPAVGYVWIGGYWNWVGRRHVWNPGHWAAPRPGYHWRPYRWEPIAGGYRMNPGRWERGVR